MGSGSRAAGLTCPLSISSDGEKCRKSLSRNAYWADRGRVTRYSYIGLEFLDRPLLLARSRFWEIDAGYPAVVPGPREFERRSGCTSVVPSTAKSQQR